VPSKILGKSGDSLADVYDVQGSIAGVEELDSESVKVVHEMGATIFSERFSTTLRRTTSTAIAQNIAFKVDVTDLPSTPSRILGISVIATLDRIEKCSMAVADPLSSREMPFFVWDTNVDASIPVRWDDNGGGTVSEFFLRPLGGYLGIPLMLGGSGQPQTVPDLIFRGLSTGFGAGEVAVVATMMIAFSAVGGLDSRGLPIPGW